ncbi:MAG: hypothetical protein NC548_30640 [Lachnospiraceae bacterium]|nr:hypothetical protein [Lachnospiraceae bacterium]
MNSKKFSEAMSELDSKYVDEAINYQATKSFKRRWLVALVAAIMTFSLIGAGVAISQYVDRVEMSERFEGIEHYDLSENEKLEISEAVEIGEIFIVPDAIATNREKITIKNNSGAEITVYLYSSDDDFNNAIQEMNIGSNREKTFTGLSSRFLYHIGIMTNDTEQIRVTITD